jgi:hypothetical protein
MFYAPSGSNRNRRRKRIIYSIVFWDVTPCRPESVHRSTTSIFRVEVRQEATRICSLGEATLRIVHRFEEIRMNKGKLLFSLDFLLRCRDKIKAKSLFVACLLLFRLTYSLILKMEFLRSSERVGEIPDYTASYPS